MNQWLSLPSLVAVFLAVLVSILGNNANVAVAQEGRVSPPVPFGALPTAEHLAWHERQFYAFVHFNMNTFTGVEWGEGTETPKDFNPTELDCRQWCALFKECGLTGVIITAKHHDGFCLWPSRFTEHDVANSNWRGGRGDVVRELADACREYGLWLGIYISPWDRNNPIYGKDDAAYNDYFVGQMEELLGNYGPIAEVWWDGANGDRNNPDKHQEYDWARFIRTVRRLQPNAVIFAPPYTPGDIRWVGNEDGLAGATQWSTYPRNVDEDPTTLNTGIEGADTWMPAETDVSIRPGWYWTRDTDHRVKSVAELLEIYYASVGHNTNLLLNFPVDNRGLVHDNDAGRMREVAAILRATFATDLATNCRASASDVRGDRPQFAAANLFDHDPTTYWATDDDVTSATVDVEFEKPTAINRAVIQEHIELGQRVRAWKIDARTGDRWDTVARGTTIGHKRIARFPTVTASAVRLTIEDAAACPVLESLSLYCAPPVVDIRTSSNTFIDETTVEMTADLPGCVIHYTLDGSEPTQDALTYESPLTIRESCTIRAAAARDGTMSPQVATLQLTGYRRDSLRTPLSQKAPPSPGLRVSKYDGGWQTLDQMADRKPASTGTCDNFDLSERLTDEHTALAFDGLLNVPADGIYQFFLASDDGSRLYIGDELVVDNDGLHNVVEKSGQIGLQAGWQPLRVEWFNAGAGMKLEVHWAGPGFAKQAIAKDALAIPPSQ
jgi:alpha-L-fucosidase